MPKKSFSNLLNHNQGIGCAMVAVGIILSAFSAHTLKTKLSPELLDSFKTGALYLILNGLALALINNPPRKKHYLYCLFFGTLLFSASIFYLVFFDLPSSISFLGILTPIGGVFMILGWVLLSIHFFKYQNKPCSVKVD
ncbi:MAG: uncharacterized membrane protein YgdD (TMEM256/DUF423 family) [Luteibaculaceae bacterium]|jgi:uncharacterized membrane protein YgdD (TMEM256/DUF423 family)